MTNFIPILWAGGTYTGYYVKEEAVFTGLKLKKEVWVGERDYIIMST